MIFDIIISFYIKKKFVSIKTKKYVYFSHLMFIFNIKHLFFVKGRWIACMPFYNLAEVVYI